MFNFSHQIDSIKSSLIGFVLVLATAIMGLVWISIGIYAFAVKFFGPEWGPVALGVLSLVPLAIYIGVKAMKKQDKRSKQQRAYDAAFAASPVGSLSQMIETMSQHSPLLAAVVAVLGGFLASRFPQFLSMFAELVNAYSQELTRHKARKAEERTRRAYDDERRGGANPPPPDVEPVSRRRGKKQTADMY
jgi:hypothetical protein